MTLCDCEKCWSWNEGQLFIESINLNRLAGHFSNHFKQSQRERKNDVLPHAFGRTFFYDQCKKKYSQGLCILTRVEEGRTFDEKNVAQWLEYFEKRKWCEAVEDHPPENPPLTFQEFALVSAEATSSTICILTIKKLWVKTRSSVSARTQPRGPSF